MAVIYRHTVTGKLHTVPEPHDEPVRRQRQRAMAIAKLDRSVVWERVDGHGDAPPTDSPVSFDPSAHSVREVNAYLAHAGEFERDRVLSVEAEGKARSSILTGPYADAS